TWRPMRATLCQYRQPTSDNEEPSAWPGRCTPAGEVLPLPSKAPREEDGPCGAPTRGASRPQSMWPTRSASRGGAGQVPTEEETASATCRLSTTNCPVSSDRATTAAESSSASLPTTVPVASAGPLTPTPLPAGERGRGEG